jgi:hypothetical protein
MSIALVASADKAKAAGGDGMAASTPLQTSLTQPRSPLWDAAGINSPIRRPPPSNAAVKMARRNERYELEVNSPFFAVKEKNMECLLCEKLFGYDVYGHVAGKPHRLKLEACSTPFPRRDGALDLQEALSAADTMKKEKAMLSRKRSRSERCDDAFAEGAQW